MKKPIIKSLIPALIAVFGLGAGIAFAQVATTTGTTTGTVGTTTSTTGTTTSTNGNATSTQATSTDATIQIMMHLCKGNIRSASDLQALESGKDPVSAFIAAEFNCPVTALPGNEAAAGTIASARTPFDFTVMAEGGTSSHRLASSTYMQHMVSEADIQRDINGDGAIATSTTLDTSHYQFMHIMGMATSSTATSTATSTGNSFMVMVTETSIPNGFSFGAVRFTPNELVPNNDRDTLVATNTANARIELDMSRDQNRTVMLHVYNFPHGTSTATSSGSGSVVNGTTTTGTVTGGTGTGSGGSSGGGTGGSNSNTGGGSVTTPAGAPASIIENLNSVQRRVQNVFDHINRLIGQ